MHRLQGLSRGGRLVLALALGGARFGKATVVQAAIPSSDGVIHGCYGKPGTPQKGELRVVNAEQVEQCRFYENQLNWNQIGPTGVTGPTGPTGPTGGINAIERQGLVTAAGALLLSSGFTVTHTGGTGTYTIAYPAGTWNFDATNFPAITAIPINGATTPVTAGTGTLFGDGSLTWVLHTGVADEDFGFHILQHNGPNNPGTAPSKGAFITTKH